MLADCPKAKAASIYDRCKAVYGKDTFRGLSFTAEGSRFLLRFTPKPQPDTGTGPVLVHEHDARIHIFVSWHEVAVTAGLRLSRSQTPTQSASAPRRLNRCGAFSGPQPVLNSFLCWGLSQGHATETTGLLAELARATRHLHNPLR